MDPATLNVPAILLATLVAFAIGGVWYSPIGFAKVWMRESGIDADRAARAGRARVFGLAALATLVVAVNLAAFIGPKASLGFGLAAGAAAGIGWVSMSLAVIYLFEQRSVKLWAVNAGYQVVAYTVMGGLLGAWT